MRSDRRYKQIKLVNKVKTNQKVRPDAEEFEEKYKELLTPYAFELMERQIKGYKDTSISSHKTDDTSCDCSFFRCIQLPGIMAEKGMNTFQQQMSFLDELLTPYAFELMERQIKGYKDTSISSHKTDDTSCDCSFFRCIQLPGIMAEKGMNTFQQQMSFLDELMEMWAQNKQVTLVETLTVNAEFELSDDAVIVAEVPEPEETQSQGSHTEETQTEDSLTEETQTEDSHTEETQPQDSHMEDTQVDSQSEETQAQDPQSEHPDLGSISLPIKTKRRGRPRGAVNRVIGLPKCKKTGGETDKQTNNQNKRRGRPQTKNTLEAPSKRLCMRLHLSKNPGSTDWHIDQL